MIERNHDTVISLDNHHLVASMHCDNHELTREPNFCNLTCLSYDDENADTDDNLENKPSQDPGLYFASSNHLNTIDRSVLFFSFYCICDDNG